MGDSVSITGLDEAAVLAALFNAAKPLGMGFMHYQNRTMSLEEAQGLLAQTKYFDYVEGRVMKIEIKDPLNPWGYDRDNGQGAVKQVIDALRATGAADNAAVQEMHKAGVKDSIDDVRQRLETPTPPATVEGNVVVMHLGLDDMGDVLGPKVDAAEKGL